MRLKHRMNCMVNSPKKIRGIVRIVGVGCSIVEVVTWIRGTLRLAR